MSKASRYAIPSMLIIDDEVWLLGTSVKDMGRGLCTIIKMGFRPEEVLVRIE